MVMKTVAGLCQKELSIPKQSIVSLRKAHDSEDQKERQVEQNAVIGSVTRYTEGAGCFSEEDSGRENRFALFVIGEC